MAWHNNHIIFDMSLPWKWRVVRASMGSTTGLVVMAMLAKEPKNGPAFGQWCNIDKDGFVESQVRREGRWHPPIQIGSVADVRDNLRRLADHCKLPDIERIELFEEFRKWIRRDHRATSEPV